MVANTGRKMDLFAWEKPVVFDMNGVSFLKDKTPIFYRHDDESIIGVSTEQLVLQAGESKVLKEGKTIYGPAILVKWKFTNNSELAREIRENLNNGLEYEVSVGARPEVIHELEAGELEVINGFEFTGPLIIADKIKVQESSICVFGACGGTTNFEAEFSADRGSDMKKFEAFLAENGFEAESLKDNQKEILRKQFDAMNVKEVKSDIPDPESFTNELDTLKSEMKAEMQESLRVSKIQMLAEMMPANHGPIRIDGASFDEADTAALFAIKSNMNADAFELACKNARLERPAGPAIHRKDNELTSEILECALVKRYQNNFKIPTEARVCETNGERYGLEAWYSEKTLEASDRPGLKDISLHGLMNAVYRQAYGMNYEGERRSYNFVNAVAEAREHVRVHRIMNASGPSPIHLGSIWENTAKKMMLASYASVPTTWQNWVKVIEVPDFRSYDIYRLGLDKTLSPLGNNGVIEHGTATAEQLSVKSDTYAKMYSATRQAIFNDDLGAILTMWASLGLTVPATIEELAYLVLLRDLRTNFTAEKGNFLQGAEYALSLQSMDTVQKAFEMRVDEFGKPILATQDRILTGIQLSDLARDLYIEKNPVVPYSIGGNDVIQVAGPNNPHWNKLFPIKSGYLDNTSIKQSIFRTTSGTAMPNQNAALWFTSTDPNNPVGAAFYLPCIGGSPIPHIETFDEDPNLLGISIRVYSDFNVVPGDTRLMTAVLGVDA